MTPEVVRDEQVARLAPALEFREDVEDGGLDRDVERAGRLVGDDDPRIAGERPGDRDALLEAARQLARLEVQVALGQAQVGGELVHALLAALPFSPVSLVTERVRIRRTVQPRLSAESGFWKTIWMDRLSSVGRREACASSVCVPSVMLPPASGLSIPRIVLARVDLPEPGLADQSERLAVVQVQVDRRPGPGRRARLCWNVFDTWVRVSASVAVLGLRDRGSRPVRPARRVRSR